MPFSFGSKVALKRKDINPELLTEKLYGFTTIESHEDTSDTNSPLFYVAATDDFSGVDPGYKVKTIQDAQYIDLYFIGEGETGACWSFIQSCSEQPCQPIDCPAPCCGSCQGGGDPGLCACCFTANESFCCGQGLYATGGYGRPHHVRIDLTESTVPPPYQLVVEQFTHTDGRPLGPSVRDRSTIVTLNSVPSKNIEITRIEFTDAAIGNGGRVGDQRSCGGNSNPCNPGCLGCASDYGDTLVSGSNVTTGYGVTATVTVYSNGLYSNGLLESVFYNEFGWQGLTGITWNNYGTGGTGCLVLDNPDFNDDDDDGPVYSDVTESCDTTYGSGRAFGRILGIAIDPTFDAPTIGED